MVQRRIVNSNVIQKDIHNVDTRSVTVDILCRDDQHGYFSVEVQKADDDDHQKRVRYNRACVQILSLAKGTRGILDGTGVFCFKAKLVLGDKTGGG